MLATLYNSAIFFKKEFILMRRDGASIIIIILLPIILLLLFGFSVNLNPKEMPVALILKDQSVFVQELISSIQNTKYFTIVMDKTSDSEARKALTKGTINFIITIPENFTNNLIKGRHPAILLETGSTNPAEIEQASNVLLLDIKKSFNRMLAGGLGYLQQSAPPASLIVHHVSNPSLNSEYFIIPGTVGLVIMLSMLMITTVVSFRDRQEGIFEYLLLSPAKAHEIVIGNISAYIIMGYLQLLIALFIAIFFFKVPFIGSFVLLFIATLPYILAELSLGFVISSLSTSQLQAVQISNIFIATSIIMSGFAFPYWGIPYWAKPISESLPLTHYLRIIRGVMINDMSWVTVGANLIPILVFTFVMLIIAIKNYKNSSTENQL